MSTAQAWGRADAFGTSTGAAVEVMADGKAVGSLQLDHALPSLTEMGIFFCCGPGEHEITLHMAGRLTIDWFRLI